MFSSRASLAARTASRRAFATVAASTPKAAAPKAAAPKAAPPPPPPPVQVARSHKVLVVGGGSAGLNVGHQLLRSGKFSQDEIAIVDPEQWHHYQAGWTLVGGGVKDKHDLRRPLAGLVDPKVKFYDTAVGGFSPEDNVISLANGDKLGYEHLIVVPGIKINYDSIKGLPEALADSKRLVSTIYGFDTADGVFPNIQRMEKGRAIFTQPQGVIKCAGAPQKIMWLALDHWKQAGLYNAGADSPIKISFATGLPTMFGVPKYSAKLEELRQERGVEGLFSHDLLEIDGNKATFANGQEKVTKEFDFLHAVPKMGPHAFVKNSKLANEAGYVDVSETTLRHNKYPNVWSLGDAANLPTSKTAAAITAQAPVLAKNLLSVLEGKEPAQVYDGYTSCPIPTEYGKLLLAEFKYGGEPKETFDDWFGLDQGVPRRAFYYMKKDFFPWVYFNSMVKGTWGGPKGWVN